MVRPEAGETGDGAKRPASPRTTRSAADSEETPKPRRPRTTRSNVDEPTAPIPAVSSTRSSPRPAAGRSTAPGADPFDTDPFDEGWSPPRRPVVPPPRQSGPDLSSTTIPPARPPEPPRLEPEAPKPERPKALPVRNRILPRSVLGIASLILAFSIGAGFSGVVLFSYYQYKLNQTNDRVNTLITGYKKDFANAEGNLNSTVSSAQANIAAELKEVQQSAANPTTLATLVKDVAPSVYFVHTLDASGAPSVGTAFVISSSASQSLLITSYTTVEAATHSPAPPVYVRQGTNNTQVTVSTWDPQYDLALIVLPVGGLKALALAPSSPAPQPGDHIYAVSGLGTAGAALTEGTVIDVSSSGIAEDAAIGPAFQGGPIINQTGQVIAIASRTYAPLGFTSTAVWYAPYPQAACNKVLSCPGGTISNSST
jgi:hypothetical protein